MRRLPKLYLLLSSVLLLAGCCISKYNHLTCEKKLITEQDIVPVIKPVVALKYKATIDVLKNHLSGLLIVKQTDSLTRHIVFVTELGMKMFDFEAKANEINAVYVFDPLNKPKLVASLKRNFNNMLLLNAYGNTAMKCNDGVFSIKKDKHKWFYTTLTQNKEVILQETFYKRKRESKIEYVYDSNNKTYSSIKCKQYGIIKFYFELNAITQTND